VGNKRGFKEKANELKSAGTLLCVGVGKSSVVPGLRQGTNLEERGVIIVITEISSAQGDKELCIISIEKQSFMAQGLTPQHIKRAKTIQSWLKN
jgi:hypothetical protein